ncbi:hypothetical protein IPM62_06020 [Candidatus Woesebacteria bacterium]|nr:MAG: hypothetical protein IPM62_06020 [Candidatus Woesebacteria bacterium]
MRSYYKILIFVALIVVSSFVVVKKISASEGVAELRSTNGEDYRCVVESQLAQDRTYKLLVTCRDLIYPSDSTVFSYILWANPTDGGKIIKLGALDFGKKLFTSKRAFTSIFITTETALKGEAPQGPVVMQGTTLPRAFLDKPTSPTPTPEGQEITEEVVTKTPDKNQAEDEKVPSTRNRLSTALRRASLIGVIILLIGAVVALVVILRSKKR